MPFYNDLRPESDFEKADYLQIFPNLTAKEKLRTIKNLIELKEGLNNEVASRKTDTNLLIASWNIKEFGHTTQRLPESYFYIAEIITRFDLVAIQEVKSTLNDFKKIMRLLGSDYEYVLNDITNGNKGNSERSAYIFNKKRVKFGGLAGELNAWDELIKQKSSKITSLSRTPFITGFKAGWKKFALINLHLHPDKSKDKEFIEDVLRRRAEVQLLLDILQAKIEDDELWTDHLILVGDFNFYPSTKKSEYDDPTVKLINDAGFVEVESLKGKMTNVSNNTAFDRFFIRTSKYFEIGSSDDAGNVFKFFNYVFKTSNYLEYSNEMIEAYESGDGKRNIRDNDVKKSYFEQYWKRNQLSDHNLVWFELNIDSSVDFLQSKANKIKN